MSPFNNEVQIPFLDIWTIDYEKKELATLVHLAKKCILMNLIGDCADYTIFCFVLGLSCSNYFILLYDLYF